MIPRKKKDSDYTSHERELMKIAVTHASPNEFFPPDYAASFLGVKRRTLQAWRDKHSDKLPFHKPSHAIMYLAKDLHEFVHNHRFMCTANYKKAG